MAKSAKAAANTTNGANPLTKLGRQVQSKQRNTNDVVVEAPLYTSNKISVCMKDGDVAVAAIINGVETQYMSDKLFNISSKDASVPNAITAIRDILQVVKDDEAIRTGRTVIAAPERVAYIINNIGLLTRMNWTGLDLLHKDKNGDIRKMTKKEKVMYSELLTLLGECAGFICVLDSKYTHKNSKTAYNDEQKEWVQVNNTSYYMLNHTDLDEFDKGEDEE